MSAAFTDGSLLTLVARPVAVMTLEDRPIAAPNPAACRLLGAPYEDGLRLPLSGFVGRKAAAQIASFAAGLPRFGVGARVSPTCVTPKGPALLAIDVARIPERDDAFVLTLEDQSADATAAQALARAEAVIHALPVGIELYDMSFNALFYNRKSDELFDYGDHDVANHAQWWDLAFPEPDRRAAARVEWEALTGAARRDPSRAFMAEWNVVCGDGESRVIQFYYQRAGDGFSSVMWDVTERRRLEGELRALAETDSLTGLPNRRAFFEIAEAWLARAQAAAPMTVLMLDVDHFKRVNDAYGHAAGDEVLAAVAARAKASLRKNDVIARLGGEEFAAFLPAAREKEAAAVARRILRAVSADPVPAGETALSVTVSIGVAARFVGETSADAVIARADRALYAAKSAGRDRFAIAEREPA